MPFLFFFQLQREQIPTRLYRAHITAQNTADKCRPVHTDSILFSPSPDIYALSCMVS